MNRLPVSHLLHFSLWAGNHSIPLVFFSFSWNNPGLRTWRRIFPQSPHHLAEKRRISKKCGIKGWFPGPWSTQRWSKVNTNNQILFFCFPLKNKSKWPSHYYRTASHRTCPSQHTLAHPACSWEKFRWDCSFLRISFQIHQEKKN